MDTARQSVPGAAPPLILKGLQQKILQAGRRLAGDKFRRKTTDCKARWGWAGHRDAPGYPAHRWRVPVGACHLGACTSEICARSNGSQRAHRAADAWTRAGEVSSLPADIAAWVLTIPGHLWQSIDSEATLGELRRAAREILELAHLGAAGLNMADGWRMGGLDVWHPEGSKQPGRWKPHVHMQICCLAWNKRTLRWKPVPCELPLGTIRWARDLWKRALERILGVSLDMAVVNLECCLFARQAKWWHRVRYDLRAFPGWVSRWRRVIRWGWASPRLSGAALGAQLDPIKDPELSRTDVCPVCGVTCDETFLAFDHVPWMVAAKEVEHEILRVHKNQGVGQGDTS